LARELHLLLGKLIKISTSTTTPSDRVNNEVRLPKVELQKGVGGEGGSSKITHTQNNNADGQTVCGILAGVCHKPNMARFASQPSKCKHRAHYHCRANDVLRLNICPTLSGHNKQHWWRTSIIRPVARLSGIAHTTCSPCSNIKK